MFKKQRAIMKAIKKWKPLLKEYNASKLYNLIRETRKQSSCQLCDVFSICEKCVFNISCVDSEKGHYWIVIHLKRYDISDDEYVMKIHYHIEEATKEMKKHLWWIWRWMY